MDISRLAATLMSSFAMLLAISAASPVVGQIDVNFINGGDFNTATNWDDGNLPTADFDRHFVQDDLTALFSSGSTSVHFLTIGDTSFGRLEMTGGSLTVLVPDQFEVGESVGGEGEFQMTGSSILTVAGAVIGTRSRGLLSVGPNAIVDLMQNGLTSDLRVGSFGPAYVPGGDPEPGLDGDGLVDVQGTLNAATLIISQSGAKGEFRLSGGSVDLTGTLLMDLCEGCGTDPNLLALRSSKVSLIGSSGFFNVGTDIRASSPTTTFSFTADAAGVTTIVAASGAAEIDMANLELNLDAFPFTPTSKLTLIDAFDIPGLLIGEFATVTFLGTTQADVNYDILNSDVFLDNFRTVGGVSGDFNGDGNWDCDDINDLTAAIAAGSTNLSFDMNGDGVITLADITDAVGWLAVGGANNPGATGGNPFLRGDATLDGTVDGQDFIVWNNNKFTVLPQWCSGDWNADGTVDGQDFIIWNTNKFMSSDHGAAAVPEPASVILLGLVGVALLHRRDIGVCNL